MLHRIWSTGTASVEKAPQRFPSASTSGRSEQGTALRNRSAEALAFLFIASKAPVRGQITHLPGDRIEGQIDGVGKTALRIGAAE